MEQAGSEVYQFTPDEAVTDYLHQLDESTRVPIRENVDSQADFREGILKRHIVTEREYSSIIKGISVRTGYISTEIMCVWWTKAKQSLPEVWQEDPEQFRKMLRIAITIDIGNLRVEAIESEGRSDHQQYMGWINGRIRHLGQFQQALEAKTVSPPSKEIK